MAYLHAAGENCGLAEGSPVAETERTIAGTVNADMDKLCLDTPARWQLST